MTELKTWKNFQFYRQNLTLEVNVERISEFQIGSIFLDRTYNFKFCRQKKKIGSVSPLILYVPNPLYWIYFCISDAVSIHQLLVHHVSHALCEWTVTGNYNYILLIFFQSSIFIPPSGVVGNMLALHPVNPGFNPGSEGYIVTRMITIMAAPCHWIPNVT